MNLRLLLLSTLLAAFSLRAQSNDPAAASPAFTNAATEVATNSPTATITVPPENLKVTNATTTVPSTASEDDTNVFRGLRMPPGFQIQLVATAPLIANPVALAFDADGRLYVVEQPGGSAAGDVKLLEDTNSDGIFDEAAVFADNLDSPSALACYGGGIFVATRSKILFLSDTTGDRIANLKRDVFGGFNQSGPGPGLGGGINNFTWGLDNQIHAAAGGVGGDIACLAIPTSQTLSLTGYDFAFNPRTLAMVIEPGGTSRGVGFDSAGHRFTTSSGNPLEFTLCNPIRATRNPLFVWPRLTIDLAWSNPDRFAEPGGLLVYRGGVLGSNFVGSFFLADPALHRVNLLRLRDAGWQPVLETSAQNNAVFLASGNPAFCPTQVVSGPDSSLYIADKGRTNAAQRTGHGRIWHIFPSGLKPQKTPQFTAFKTPELVGLLGSPDGWVRDTAARLLFERQDAVAVPLLAKQLTRAKDPQTRLQTLYALDGLSALTEPEIIAALNDGNDAIRLHAARLAEHFVRDGGVSDPLWLSLAAAAHDRSPHVRFETALTLGLIQRPAVAGVLADVLRGAPTDGILQAAALTAARGHTRGVFMDLLGDWNPNETATDRAVMRELARMTGEENTTGMDQVLTAIERARLTPQDSLMLARSVGEGLSATGRSFVGTAPQGTWRAFGLEALNIGVGNGSPDVRAEAIGFVGVSGYTTQDVGDWLLALLAPGEPQAVQSAAIDALGRFHDPRITTAFIQRWPVLSAQSQNEIIATLLGGFEGTFALMTALEQGRIPRSALSDVQVNFLRAHRDPTTAARAVKLFGPLGQTGLAERFAGVLRLSGSAARGHELFRARCANCHQLGGEGQAFGPNLDADRTRGREKLLQDILEPNREINPDYKTEVIQRTDNQLLFGLVSKSGADVYVVRRPNHPPVWLPRTQVDDVFTQDWSLMPVDAAAGLSTADLANLLAFITGGR